MDVFTVNDLENLMKDRKEPAISAFIPTYSKGNEVQQNPTRFKNVLQDIDRKLIGRGHNNLYVRNLLDPAIRLMEDPFFWNHQNDGLAIFIAENEFYHYRLPINFKETVQIWHRFHITPLLPVLSEDEVFFVLALDLNEVKLYQGTRHSISEILIKDMVTNFQESLKYDIQERGWQAHGESGRQGQSFIAYGLGSRVDDADHKQNLLLYFRDIDKALHSVLRGGTAPLIVMGVEYLIPIYKEANTYQHLLEDGIPKDPGMCTTVEIHKWGLEIADTYFAKSEQKAIARYEQFYNSERTSDNIEEIIKAAFTDRIETLFVNKGAEPWGRIEYWGKVDPMSFDVSVHEEPKKEDDDLLDIAVGQTVLHNGSVFLTDTDRMPEAKPIAAVFRY